MSRKLIIFLLIGAGLFVFGGDAEAYDDKTTHPALTSEIIDFYNSLHPENQITPEEKDWIIFGSSAEDTPPRWLNHFYDPVNQTGWTGLKAGALSPDAFYKAAVAGNAGYAPAPAIDWVNNNSLQENLSLYGGNRTWQKGLDYYVSQNLKEAYITLGHALHLLEDMAVPEHTRDDTHAPLAFAGDEGSPFEDYAVRWNPGNIKSLGIIQKIQAENLKPPVKSNISDYLAALAEYSNKYFFSKDTINDQKYQFPKIVREDGKFGYGIDENGIEFPLIFIGSVTGDTVETIKIYSIKNKDEYGPVLKAYFSHLSKQAVLYGAGVIDLFYKQANDAVVNAEFPTHLVKYDFSFLPIKAVSIIGEGAKIMTATKSFFGSITGSAKEALSVIVQSFQNSAVSPQDLIQDQETAVDSKENATQLSLGENLSINIPATTETSEIPEIKITETPEAPEALETSKQESQVSDEPLQSIVAANENEEEINNEEEVDLAVIQNQLDDISDQIDDLSFRVAVVTKSASDNKAVSPELRAKIESTSNQKVKLNEENNNQNQTATNNYSAAGSGISGGGSENKVYPKIIINEIQLASASSTHDEFVELYNPNNDSVDLTDWYLQKKTASGSSFSTFAPKNSFASESIPERGYLLIAHPSSTFSADIFTDYGLADNNVLVLKNPNGEIVDKVGWGNANDCDGVCAINPVAGQSLQRKNSSADFVDTDSNVADFEIQTCPSPEQASRNCSTGSSGNSSGNATSSEGGGPKRVLISEIMAGGIDSGDEFIELYNPNNVAVNISNYSIQYVSGGATSTENALKKNFETGNVVPAKGFFLVGRGLNASSTDGYRGLPLADMTYRIFSLSAQGATVLLVKNQSLVSSFSDANVADSIAYSALDGGTSFERKVLVGSTCVSPRDSNEFSGNDCDTDNVSDFEIRSLANPQNSQSLSEPRNGPAVSDFNWVYSSSTAILTLSWSESADNAGVTSSVVYELRESSSTLLFNGTSTFQFLKSINDTGRDYSFSLRAFDVDGLGGPTSTLTALIAGDGITHETPAAFHGIRLERVIRKPDNRVQVRFTVTSDLDTSKSIASFRLFRIYDNTPIFLSIGGISPSLQKTAGALNEFAASPSCYSDFKWSDYTTNTQYVIDFPSRYTNLDIKNGDALGLDYSYTTYPCMNGRGGEMSGELINYEIGEDRRPNLSSLRQIKAQTQAVISEGSKTIEDVVLTAVVESPDGNNVKLEIELRPIGETFTGIKNYESNFVSSGNEARINISGLSAGQYHWRGRALDNKNNASRFWSEFGAGGNSDFEFVAAPAFVANTSNFYGLTLDKVILKNDGGLEVKFTTVDIDALRGQATTRFLIMRAGDARSVLRRDYLNASAAPSLNTIWPRDQFWVFGVNPDKCGPTDNNFSQYVNGTQYTITYPTEVVDEEMFAGNQVYLEYQTTNGWCDATAPNFTSSSAPFVLIQSE